MKNTLLNVKNLKTYFPLRSNIFSQQKGFVYALDDVSVSVNEGEILGLVGESGCGKTTLGRTILKLIEPTGGEIYFRGEDITKLNSRQMKPLRQKMQMIFQDPYSSLNPRMKIGKIIAEPFKIHNAAPKNDIEGKTKTLLETVGLSPEYAGRYPHEFSGGEKQRIGIARALALNPSFIILDEPISALDVSIQGQILNLLMELQEIRNLTYLFVSHDLAAVEHISTRIAVMYAGKIVEENTSDELYHRPLHPYSQSLLHSIPEIVSTEWDFKILPGEIPSPENLPGGCHFHPRCKFAMDICKKEFPKKNIKHIIDKCLLFF